MLREEVTSEDIAAVVARWTGIPMERMLEGEREKLLAMEETIGKRVIGQERGRAGGQPRDPPLRAPAFRTRTGRWAASCSSARPGVGKTELTKSLAEFLFDDPPRDGPDRHVGVHGEAQRRPPDRRPSRLCRL